MCDRQIAGQRVFARGGGALRSVVKIIASARRRRVPASLRPRLSLTEDTHRAPSPGGGGGRRLGDRGPPSPRRGTLGINQMIAVRRSASQRRQGRDEDAEALRGTAQEHVRQRGSVA